MAVEDHEEALRLLTSCIDLCLALGLTCREVDEATLEVIRRQPPLDRFPRTDDLPDMLTGFFTTLRVIAHRHDMHVPV